MQNNDVLRILRRTTNIHLTPMKERQIEKFNNPKIESLRI